jgi:hypothetical protein
MACRCLIFAVGIALFFPAISVSSGFGGDQSPLSPEIQKRLSKTYPNLKIVNGCSGKFVGKETDAITVLHNRAKKEFLVVWVMLEGHIQELDSVSQADSSTEFDLQCLSPKEAKELEDTLQRSEGVTSSVKIPKGSGAVCYFIDSAVANCWSLDRASGRLIRAGAWET